MKICNKCGAQNVDNASFCGTCGNVFPKDEQIVNQPQGSYEQPQNDGYNNQGMFYLFPLILPFTKGNVVKTLIIGLVALIIGLYFVTDMAPDFTMAANQVYKATGDNAAHIPDGFSGGALDFASSLVLIPTLMWLRSYLMRYIKLLKLKVLIWPFNVVSILIELLLWNVVQ